MLENVKRHSTHGRQMTEAQKQWLNSLGLADDKSIVDCNPSQSTVLFADGRRRTVTERWTRVMGYHRPVSAFNKGKQAEHRERVYFRESKVG